MKYLALTALLLWPLLAAENKPTEIWDRTRTVKLSYSLNPSGNFAYELENRGDKAVKVTLKGTISPKNESRSKRQINISEPLKGRAYKKDQINLVLAAPDLKIAREKGLEVDLTEFRVDALPRK